ncbi:MAG: isoleucine--tRNA ligase, partial [Bacteroidales bacterium]|nr:isoleucine--tRNA ligase [Bacteroidales bacterium]
MESKYREYKQLNLTQISNEVLEKWQKEDTFRQTLKQREGSKPYIFFEGPPSANGQPGIHHVMARTIKDIFCRYKSQKGYYVARKAGWDTHGLPVELGVEKKLGITKEDIGGKISVDQYNAECRSEVMKYKDMWDKLTTQMGYWVDLDNPYITFKNEYIETLWYLLGKMYEKGYLYKGYTIQPFSPAAGTGLSSHELNMPGCYRDVKDTTAVVQFKVKQQQEIKDKFKLDVAEDVCFLAWTTTPWTLPSNTALAVGPNIDYVFVKTFNPYSGDLEVVVMAKTRLNAYCPEKNAGLTFEEYKKGDKDIPFEVLAECKGVDLIGFDYEQLMNFVAPMGDAFRVIGGDYVTTEDGTGIVHIAPTFGADDDRVAKQAGIVPLFMIDKEGKKQPMVDRQGKFFRIEDLDAKFVSDYVNVESYGTFAGRFVKNAYDPELTEKDPTLDVDLSVLLKQEGKAFKIEKHLHNYPHCWRTDKPILYYPLDSWFIRTTAIKDKLISLNKTINWKPEATGSGRFGNWLENLVDWNLSRSRYWGTPLPIWRTEDGSEEMCISSVEMLSNEIEKSIAAGFMKENPYKNHKDYNSFDLHRPYIDNVVLVSASGKEMRRESDLIDVWFDSGAMPYAQVHYPFECNDEQLKACFPADFIAEGVDQTRGWFFTLHAIAALCFDTIAFKNVVSNGLVLDKVGNKMSKRLGNAVDPFEVLKTYGPDATRWYMITNTQPWENLKFDQAGIDEVRRKFFGT